jgi:hypothetical protein
VSTDESGASGSIIASNGLMFSFMDDELMMNLSEKASVVQLSNGIETLENLMPQILNPQ